MKKILFVCVGNSARSQMAEGFARVLGQGRIEAYSAGSQPARAIAPLAIEVMREKNIDISGQRPKGLDKLSVQSFDYVVSMGCEAACPLIPAQQYIEWSVPDPHEKPIQEFREVRDEIEEHVEHLLTKIGE